jgi:hypothetical protein
LLCSAIAPAARAERPDRRGNDGYRHSDLRDLADDTEKLADRFRSQLDRELDRTIIDGTKREKQVEKRAAKLEDALDDVRSSVRDGKKPNHTRDRVKRAVRYAHELEQDLVRLRLSPGLHQDWRQLQGRLNKLAYYYELTPRHAAMPGRGYR